MEQNLHKDHRSRVRNRYIKEGLDHFEDHQVLEFLLFHTIPRRDVNPLAHQLLETFGSFAGVLDATYDELLRCPGVGEYTAAFLSMIPSLCRRYLMDRQTRYPCFGDMHKLGSYLVNYFVGETREKLIAVYLNNRSEMIDLEIISEGVVNKTDANLRRIVEGAVTKRAAAVVLAHNHPDGPCVPSDADVSLTSFFGETLKRIDIPLSEHFVVAESRYVGICHYINAGRTIGLEGLKELCMGSPDSYSEADEAAE
jgi:DNA repair protein RadC